MTKEERWLLEEKYGGDANARGFAADKERLACGEPLAYVIGWQPFLGLQIRLDSRPLIPRSETEWWTEQLLKTASSLQLQAYSGDQANQLAAQARSAELLPLSKTVGETMSENAISPYLSRGKRHGVLGALGADDTQTPLLPASPVSILRKSVFEKGVSQDDEPRGGDFLAKKYAAPFEGTPDANHFFFFLDLCAGSGAIGCAALARLPSARVFFGELDPAHEATIRKNIADNVLDASRAEVRMGDLFAPFAGMRFDAIAANPPYIPQGRALPESVSAYEPASALYAGIDGLDLIRRILDALPDFLAPKGEAWIEIDASQSASALSLARTKGLSGVIRNDQYGVPRVLVVSSS